jgi:hypothetical protein
LRQFRGVPWCFPGTPVSPNNKSDLHIIIEILLKGALSAISPKSYPNFGFPVPKII